MRKHELIAMTKALKDHNDLLKKERDEARSEARDAVNEALAKMHGAVKGVKGDVASLHEKADAHAAALATHGERPCPISRRPQGRRCSLTTPRPSP